MRRALAAAIAAIVVVLAACGPEEHTLTVGNVTIVDAIDLVKAARESEPPNVPDMPAAIRGDGLDQLILVWGGSGCTASWSIRISGNAISAVIQPGPERGDCAGAPSPLILKAVTLDLTRAVDAEKVSVTFAEASGS